MTTPVWTWLAGQSDPVQAAEFELESGRGRFTYLPGYREQANARALDPLQLRFTRSPRGLPFPSDDGLPGVIRDATPAGYGADRLRARLRVPEDETISPLVLLEAGPPDGVGAIEVCADIEKKLRWRPHSWEDLLAHVTDLDEDAPASRAIRRLDDDGGTSAGGERPKVTIEHQGRLWLAKLQDRGDTPNVPAREHVAMQLARELGMRVPEVLFHRQEGREIYLIERFDRRGDPSRPQRSLFASAHTVLRLPLNSTPGDARRSYLVLADEMRRWISDVTALREDLQELWTRICFNALVGNHDDHPRNHGLIHDGSGWRLSPLFDVTPLRNYAGMLAMNITAEGSAQASVLNLLMASRHFGLEMSAAAAWLAHAAERVAGAWRQGLLAKDVPHVVIDDLAPAFQLAEHLAEHPDRVDDAAQQADAVRAARRRRAHRDLDLF